MKMIFCDIPKIEEAQGFPGVITEDLKKQFKSLPKNSDICIIDRSEVERLWPLNPLEATTVHDLNDALSEHSGKIYYLCADLNIKERISKTDYKFIPLVHPYCFRPNIKLNKIDIELTHNFINLTSAPKAFRIALLEKYYKHPKFEYSLNPFFHGNNFKRVTIKQPLQWHHDYIQNISPYHFISTDVPVRELTEVSENWKPGMLDKTYFDDYLPKEAYNCCCDVVTESYVAYDSVLFTEKIFKEILFKRPFITLGAKNQNHIMKDLGFKLYDEIFDYEFDKADTLQRRFEGFCNQIDRYINEDVEEFSEKLKVLKDKIEYNEDLLKRKYNEYEDWFDLIGLCHSMDEIFVESSELNNLFKKVLNDYYKH